MERILAEVNLDTVYGANDYTVEVLSTRANVFGLKIAYVHVIPIDGHQARPFTEFTNGGGYQNDYGNVYVADLKNIRIAVDMPAKISVEG